MQCSIRPALTIKYAHIIIPIAGLYTGPKEPAQGPWRAYVGR